MNLKVNRSISSAIGLTFLYLSASAGSPFMDSLRSESKAMNPRALEELSEVFYEEELPNRIRTYAGRFVQSEDSEIKVKGLLTVAESYISAKQYDKADRFLDSLKQAKVITGHSKSAADMLLLKSRIAFDQGDESSFRLYNSTAFRMSDSLDYVRGEVISKLNSAQLLLSNGKAHRALIVAKEALEISRVADKELRWKVQRLIADCKVRLEKYELAHEEYQYLLKKYKEKGNLRMQAALMHSIAELHRENDHYKQSESYLLNAKNLYEQAGMAFSAAVQLELTGDLMRDHSPPQSVYYYEKAVKSFADLNRTVREGKTRLKLGRLQQFMSEPDKALAHYGKALQLFKSVNAVALESKALLHSADVYREKGTAGSEADYLNRAYKRISKHGTIPEKIELLELLSAAYAAQGNYSEAYKIQGEQIKLKDTLNRRQLLKQTGVLENELEASRTKSGTQAANARREIQELKKQNEKLNTSVIRNRFIYIISFLIVTFLIVYGAYKRIKLKRVMKKLDVELEETRYELSKYIETDDRRSKKLANQLRKGIARTVTGIKHSFERFFTELTFETNMQQARFKQALEYLEETNKELITISEEIAAEDLMNKGLVTSIRALTERVFNESSVAANFDYFGLSSDERFHLKTEMNVYKVTEELLLNVYKHSAAHKVNVRLSEENNELEVMIEDDGKGFTPNINEVNTSGKGLVMIRARVKFLNADLYYKKRPGGGTITVFKAPAIKRNADKIKGPRIDF